MARGRLRERRISSNPTPKNSRSTVVKKPGKNLAVTPPTTFLTIPCAIDPTPEKNPPDYIWNQDANGKTSGVWQCPYCCMEFLRRKSCLKHMGKIMNVPSHCKVSDFNAWFEYLITLASQLNMTPDRNCRIWRIYFNDKMTVEQALAESISTQFGMIK